MTPEQRVALEQLRKEHRIVFPKRVTKNDWPPNHRSVFSSIQKLGQITYDDYGESEDSSTTAVPWKVKAKELAGKLADKAEDCLRRNEASWRFSCEPLIFARFNSEVACPNCRKRVWRSEIEVSPSPQSSGAEQLQLRQQKRKPCRCPPTTRPQDLDEIVGLNRIFIDRAQESVIHSPALAKKLAKREQPDRVFGLCETRNFQSLLYSQHEKGKLVREVIQRQPYSEDGRPLLFPFLVVEAKSSKSDDDWHSIKLQTAFPIFTFLEVQQSLRLAAGQRSRWDSGPLVWFFMSKGEDWRLCAAYQSSGGSAGAPSGPHKTDIIELWKGCIDSRDGALQLCLIVDYVCDWARDIYRPAILNELRVLAFSANLDLPTVFTDSDIYSTRGFHFTKGEDGSFESEIQGETVTNTATNTIKAFRDLKSDIGVVRHASVIESRFYALFITRDNVETMLHTIPVKMVQTVSRQILSQISSRSLLLLPEQLNKIEQSWTGNTLTSRLSSVTQTEFYTVVTITSYITEEWEQVRDLSVIAVAKDSFELLVAAAHVKRGLGIARDPVPYHVNKDRVVATISQLKDGSVRHNLLAAICRTSLRIQGYDLTESGDVRLYADDTFTWVLVQQVYRSLKLGILEPVQPFLRISSQLENQEIRTDCEGPFHFPKGLMVSSSEAVLIHGDCDSKEAGQGQRRSLQTRGQRSSLCIYLVCQLLEPPNEGTLATILQDTFENFDVYHTTRDNGNILSVYDTTRDTLNINEKLRKNYTAPWNIKNSYGVFYHEDEDKDFKHWLRNLTGSTPIRQGSPRGLSEFGNMLQREWNPWQDPRNKIGLMWGRRNEFIQEHMASECAAWRKIARSRYRSGIQCCACCAKLQKIETDMYGGVCHACTDQMLDAQRPLWFSEMLENSVRARRWKRKSKKVAKRKASESESVAKKRQLLS